jgi:hypothetical protein
MGRKVYLGLNTVFKSQRDFASKPKVGAWAPTLGSRASGIFNRNAVVADSLTSNRAATPLGLMTFEQHDPR